MGENFRDSSPLLRYDSNPEIASPRPQSNTRRRLSPSIFYFGVTIVLLALLSSCLSMYQTLSHMEVQLSRSLDNNHKPGVPNALENHHIRHHGHHPHQEDLLPMAMLPSKYAVKHVTPRQDQAHRGTCWDFATIGFLEQSYRAHGIARGWLEEDEYVSFSEQAYGVEVLKLCSGPPDSPQQRDCRVAGDYMWNNSTEGGEVPELYYLRHGLEESVFPTAVCKYYENDGNDTLCPGMETHRKTNPLYFRVNSMETRYDDMTARENLFRKGQAMPLSTPVAMTTHYYPCINEFATHTSCQPESCTLCPPDLAMTTCCVPLTGGRNRNMEGEWFSHYGMSIEGGHAMLLVGYNDAFQTREGFTGGLIVKNSWADGPTQGSHTLDYWMQDLSDWEERTICPNSHNPFNWYHCGNVGKRPNETMDYDDRVEDCLSDETIMFANVNVQPLQLECQDPERCRTDGDFKYFVQNTTDWGDHMTVMCVWEYSSSLHIAREKCLEPMLELDLARALRPVADEIRENDSDRCGFYFIPYKAVRAWITQFQGFFVNSFDVDWHPQSYAANSYAYPDLDYSLLLASTKKQHTYDFDGPFPNAHVARDFHA